MEFLIFLDSGSSLPQILQYIYLKQLTLFLYTPKIKIIPNISRQTPPKYPDHPLPEKITKKFHPIKFRYNFNYKITQFLKKQVIMMKMYMVMLLLVTVSQTAEMQEIASINAKIPSNSYKLSFEKDDIIHVYCTWSEATNIDVYLFATQKNIVYSYDSSVKSWATSAANSQNFQYRMPWGGIFYFTLKLATNIPTDYNFTVVKGGQKLLSDLNYISSSTTTQYLTTVTLSDHCLIQMQLAISQKTFSIGKIYPSSNPGKIIKIFLPTDSSYMAILPKFGEYTIDLKLSPINIVDIYNISIKFYAKPSKFYFQDACVINCSEIEHALATSDNFSCVCQSPYFWDIEEFVCISPCLDMQNSVMPIDGQCSCRQGFSLQLQDNHYNCMINCSNIQYAQYSQPPQTNSCTCPQNYQWSSNLLRCQLKVSVKNTYLIVIIVLGVGVFLAIAVLVWQCCKLNRKQISNLDEAPIQERLIDHSMDNLQVEGGNDRNGGNNRENLEDVRQDDDHPGQQQQQEQQQQKKQQKHQQKQQHQQEGQLKQSNNIRKSPKQQTQPYQLKQQQIDEQEIRRYEQRKRQQKKVQIDDFDEFKEQK